MSENSERTYPEHPLTGVGAVVFRGDAVLLIRRGNPPLAGEWSLPGGLADPGETLTQAVEREVAEECGIRIEVIDLVTQFEYIQRDESGRARYHYLVFDFAAEYRGGDLLHSSDASDARWFTPAEFGTAQVTGDVRRVVKEARELRGK
jgi:ADP-ribose pyrophosphatase YjhB (NUDIX family)